MYRHTNECCIRNRSVKEADNEPRPPCVGLNLYYTNILKFSRQQSRDWLELIGSKKEKNKT